MSWPDLAAFYIEAAMTDKTRSDPERRRWAPASSRGPELVVMAGAAIFRFAAIRRFVDAP